MNELKIETVKKSAKFKFAAHKKCSAYTRTFESRVRWDKPNHVVAPEKEKRNGKKKKKDELNWARVNIFHYTQASQRGKRWKNKNEIKNYVY